MTINNDPHKRKRQSNIDELSPDVSDWAFVFCLHLIYISELFNVGQSARLIFDHTSFLIKIDFIGRVLISIDILYWFQIVCVSSNGL